MKRIKVPSRLRVAALFALFVFCVLTVTMAAAGAALYGLYQSGHLTFLMEGRFRFPITLALFAVVSVVVGTLISFMASRVPLRPLHILMDGMAKLAEGEFQTRIDLGDTQIGESLSESFNLLAEELENTEVLRSDFVNSFSHEFKTPIVSILGFARLLRRGAAPPERQAEYLGIIEEESARLAAMATNVLNLTRIENQSILTDVARYDLSEQLRTCILLLEKKWAGKDLRITAEFGEYMVRANEELLKEVWINLLDNAVKFTPRGGEVTVSISQGPEGVTVGIKNTGSEISEADRTRIFRKFYQGEASHSGAGNGLGLSIAKRIVELHQGRISVTSGGGETTFFVALPEGRRQER